ncbi:dynein axonemal heavy chain 5-like [Pelodytes ibericus]
MDERHWWLAGKVQETLHLEHEEDASAELEAFFMQPEILQMINSFLQAEGLRTLFFFVEIKDKASSKWKLHLKSELQSLENMTWKTPFPALLYFLRSETSHDVDPALMEKEIFCGEIKENPVESLKSLLNELCIPILRAQKHWGSCSQESVTHFLSGLEKYVAAIEDATANSEKQQIMILRRPQNILSPEFLQQRTAILDPEIVEENETLVSEWIKTIDHILMETGDERVRDITTSPLTELERWHRRQKIWGVITEQLRGKECKTVIGLLISAKSRLLKKWKVVDISITDATNVTKDRVKYLEALYRHLDALATGHDPVTLISSVLPTFFNGIKQIETMSRFFSRNGYLGLLLTKVSNQLAQNCRAFLRESLVLSNSEDKLWDRIKEHVREHKEESKGETVRGDSSLHDQIQACLALHAYFQESLHHLREWLLGTQGMHRYSSLSSISSSVGKLSSIHTVKTNKASVKKPQSVTSSYDQQHDYQNTGVAITDDDTIMYNLEVLHIKLKQIADIMEKLQEFKILSENTEGLRKPAQDDLIEDDESESGSICEVAIHEEPKETDAPNELKPQQAQMARQNIISPGKLQTLLEEDEAQISAGDYLVPPELSGKYEDILIANNELSNFQTEEQIHDFEDDTELLLSNEEKHMLANLYNGEDMDDVETTLSSILLDKIEQIIDMLRQYIDTDVLMDTERRDNNPIEEGYSEFLVMNQQAETYISVYIRALFIRTMPTKEALSILQRFSVVSHRQGIKHILNECYLAVFDRFYEELKDIKQVNETFKDDPVLPKNMPPAAGAITWSRKLLSNIESIMKAFRNVRIVTMCLTYSQTVKLYNRIATALLSYEESWYQKWRAQVDKNLSGLNFTLLVRDSVTQQLMVNTDWRIIHLIEETKWMLRLGIHVPEAAVVAFQQGEKFKMYKSDLQDMVSEYEKLKRKIPQSFAVLFSSQLERVNHHFQPALSTLSWNSVNIEALLHQANAAVKRFQAIFSKVMELKKNVIEKTLEKISYFDIFPVDKITDAPKSPEEFLQLLKGSVLESKAILEVMASTIKSAFTDIIKTLSTLQDKKALNHQLYQAVYMCTYRSLLVLAQLTGCNMGSLSTELLALFNQIQKDTKHLLNASELIGTSPLSFIKDLTSRSLNEDLRFKLMLTFKIPHIMIDPPVQTAQEALQEAVVSIYSIGEAFSWWSGETKGQSFHMSMTEDEILRHIESNILKVMLDLKPIVKKQVFSLSCYDFLWSDNMYRQSEEFLDCSPGLMIIHKEVKRFLHTEQKIKECPEMLQLGCICLDYSFIKETLKGFAGSWKSHYASILHQQVKQNLASVVQYREKVWQQLTVPVQSLEQLNICITLLEEVQDMENKIDDVYQPIEMMYEQLSSYQLRIPREEVMEVTNLRHKWTELLNLTYIVKETLLKEKEEIFQQELDKQIKSFVVEVIQFRNSFDTQGPAAPGLKPEEVVARLHDFKEKYLIYDTKRKTLISVQQLFNIVPKTFPELDRTGKDLQLLGTLYILFQKFIDFDQKFRNTLWAEVDLTISNKEIEQYWSECLIWNDKLKDWDAYNEMAREVKYYVDIFPLLHELKTEEIRNRHWLQVMSVTGSSFPLEANVFRVSHILDFELLKFQGEILSIAKAAKKEMDFEIKMRKVEEEWSEQVLSFMPHKSRGLVLLVKVDTLTLLEQLEDAQVLLAQMLTSKEIDPLREEASTWAEKLKRVGEVLELWIEVQDLWQNLEEIFSNSMIIKELPREARRFAKVNRSWTLMMRSTYKTKNVLQCCCTGDVPKESLLRHFYQELEICYSSLNSYLGRTRQTFFRFYFLSDLALLSVLRRPCDIRYLQHHFRSLFGGISSIDVEVLEEEESPSSEEESPELSLPALDFLSVRSGNEGLLSVGQRSTTHVTDTESIFQRSLQSAGASLERNQPIPHKEPDKRMNAVAVRAHAGEMLQLDEKVAIAPCVGVWLSKLQENVRETMKTKIYQVTEDINHGMPFDEWTQKYTAQVTLLGLLFLWTRDCENFITEMKHDRKAYRALKKYSGFLSKLSAVSSRGYWKHSEDAISQCQRLKLENMIMQLLYLRDVMDAITSQKYIEISDFEWKKLTRFYLKESDGMQMLEINILDVEYLYGCEFYGAHSGLIMNPVTEKCFLKISQMLQQASGVVLQGDHGVGKTETIKGLSYLLGNFLFVFTCSLTSDISAIPRILNGTALDGCWSCFDDFHLLPSNAVSVFMHGANALYDSLKTKLSKISKDGYKVAAHPNCSLFLTVAQQSGCPDLPNNVRALFRAVSLVVPDHTVLLKARLTSLGFKNPKALATRLQLISELLKEQLPEECHQHFGFQSMTQVIYRACQRRDIEKGINGQQTRLDFEGGRVSRSSSVTSYQQAPAYVSSPVPSLKTGNSTRRNKKNSSSNPALIASKESHALIADALQDIIGPRMTGHSYMIFKQIVGDVFMGIYDTFGAQQISQKELEKAIVLKAEESKLFPHSPWLNKVKQLFNLSLVNPGVVVAGPPASGKSSCISALVQALNHLQVSTEEPVHKLVKINPLSLDNDTLMFGVQSPSHVWKDGIVTYAWKKAIRNHSSTWIWFDGHLSSSWADNFNSVLGPEKVLQLSSGDHLEFPNNMKLLFETTDLQLASPATLTKAGILYMESDALGWAPLSKVWLDGRNQQEKAVLSKAFYKTLDPIFSLILHETKPLVPVTEVGLFHTCTNLLTVMLNDKAQSIGGQLHIERLFIFCLIWSVGSLIETSERKKFSELLKVYTSVLPDDDHEISVFDYYLDESGEWDTWQSRLPELAYIGSPDIMGEVFIETEDTMIVRTFLEYASMGSQHVLLTGPPGCGKTALMNDLISTQDRSRTLLKRMVFSRSSKARELQELLEQNIDHRQGFIYGAKDGKTLSLFIDDLNLPSPDGNGVQRCNELLRMLLDDKVLLTLNKPFEWRSLESLLVKAIISFPKYATNTERMFSQRLLRHFAIFSLPDLEGTRLQQVIFSVLEANMNERDGFPLQEEMQLSLAKASYHLLESIKKTLVPSSTPGRQHYLFSLREISKIFQSLRKMSNEDREDRSTVLAYWLHESNCIIKDKLCRHSDLNWFNSELRNTTTEFFSDISIPSLQKMFITFPLEIKFSHQASTAKKAVKVQLQSISKLDDVRPYLQTIVQHYNEELGHQKLHIELSDNVVMQIIRIHRVLSCEHGGNVLLVGSEGSPLSTLAKLALYVADIPLHVLDTSGHNNFINSLKSAIQISAVEGKTTAILLTAKELVVDSYLDVINSLLICGEYASLFTTEEMNDLLQVLGPSLRRKHPHLSYDPARYLVSQVKSLLRIMVCLPPYHGLLNTASRTYPGFSNGCQLIWIDSWSQDVVNKEAKHYLMQHQIMETYTEEIRDKVALAISLIHTYMLKENNQVPWSDGFAQNTPYETTKEVNGASEGMGEKSPAHYPYCKDIIQERIELLAGKDRTAKCDSVFIGPSTLQIFLDNFKCIFLDKRKEQDNTTCQIQSAIETLGKTRNDAKATQELITGLERDYREAQVTAEEILNKLITKTSILERLKAELGVGDKTLQIFLSQNDNEFQNLEEDEDLLKDDSADEYDDAFNSMKEASMKSHSCKITEKIDKATSDLKDVRNSLQNAKNQVMHWCSKVDKSCIERLVRCQNPPYLVAQILEMALVMVNCLSKVENSNGLQKSPLHLLDSSESRGSSQFQPSPVAKSSKRGKFVRDPSDKVDRARWKNLQYNVGDSSKFVDMINQIAKLEDGLPDQTLKDIETYLGRAKEGTHGVTGEGSLLENAVPHATPQSITPAKKYSHVDNSKIKNVKKGEITIATARYSSEDAASLVAFIVAIVEYTRLCGPLKECLKCLSDLEREKDELVLKETQASMVSMGRFSEDLTISYHQILSSLTEDDIPALQAEVAKLHEEYDTSVNRKHILHEELLSHQEKLEAALDMLERLKTQEQEWKNTLNQSSISDLLTNCLLAAAFLSYCSALTTDGRSRVTSQLFKVCENCGLHLPQRTLLKDFPVIQFLHSPIEIKTLQKKGLPTNPLALDNFCMFTNTKGNHAWTLVSDPTCQAIEWIKGHLPKDSVEVMYHDLGSEMDTCLIDGRPLLLTYCDVQALLHDLRFTQVLHSKREFKLHKVPFKMMVAEHEVECHPLFNMYLHTTSTPDKIPPEVASYCNILFFCQDREGMVEQLMDRFVQQEKPRLREEHLLLKQECLNSMVQISDLEGKILATLQNGGSLLQDLSVTKRLGDLKLQHEEATEMYLKMTSSEQILLHSREGFRDFAVRGAIMYDTSRRLQQLNPMYDTSFNQLVGLFDLSIAHSERYPIKGVVSCVTNNIFSYISQSLLEKDRLVYALLLAFEVENSLGRIRPGEKEFVISPDFCVKACQRVGSKVSESRLQAKNPFDWMTEEQFRNVQILATYYDWFGDLFDRMYKDGKDLSWKTFCESEQPENPSKVKWPEGLEELNPLQQLLVLRAVRPDRLLPSASNYISGTLGKMYAAPVTLDLQASLASMSPTHPALLIYDTDSSLPQILLLELAKKQNQKIIVLPISMEEETVEEIIRNGMSEGDWILLENVQNSTKLMMSLEEILRSNQNIDKNFRLWLSIQVGLDLPIRLLHRTVKIVVNMPMNMKSGIIHSWQFVSPNTLSLSRRPDWPALLHNFCFMHCATRLRTLFGSSAGWNFPNKMRFGTTELLEGLELLKREFKDDEFPTGGRNVSWTTIRSLLSEIIYGSSISDVTDMTSFTSMVDYWISSSTTKKDYELTKLKYKVHPAFFVPDLSPISLTQALESIPQYALDVPDAFHMYNSPVVEFGQERYVFSKLYELFESQSRLVPHYNINNTQASPKVVNPSPRSTTVTSSDASLKSSDYLRAVKLSETNKICTSLLTKVPKGWSKEFINDRLKTLGGETPFNLFLKKELDHLSSLLSEIRRNLQNIKDFLESPDMLGDQLSETTVTIIQDLHHRRAPTYWCKLAWSFTCPSDWSISSWISDLQQRVTHLEKILQLGREKMPTFWLGAFKNPKGLLSVLKQEAIRKYSLRTGNAEPMHFKTEITQRDKEHIRDPPHEGMFVYGVHLWGVFWNKTDAEIIDSAPKQSLNILPVIYLQCLPMSEKTWINDSRKEPDIYLCPVYFSSTSAREPILNLDIHKENIASSRWALRGMKATVHPF